MRLNKKIILTLLLLLTSLLWMIFRDVYQGTVLLVFSILAMVTIEKRELDRNFYLALRKLYLCTDIDGFNEVLIRIQNNSLLRQNAHRVTAFLRCVGQYHLGNRTGLVEKIQTLKMRKNYIFWQYVYLSLLDQQYYKLSVLEKAIKTVPVVSLELASQRLRVMQLLMQGHKNVEDVIRIREQLTYNLLVAELTLYLSALETHPRIKAYYLKSATNLRKDFIL